MCFLWLELNYSDCLDQTILIFSRFWPSNLISLSKGNTWAASGCVCVLYLSTHCCGSNNFLLDWLIPVCLWIHCSFRVSHSAGLRSLSGSLITKCWSLSVPWLYLSCSCNDFCQYKNRSYFLPGDVEPLLFWLWPVIGCGGGVSCCSVVSCASTSVCGSGRCCLHILILSSVCVFSVLFFEFPKW